MLIGGETDASINTILDIIPLLEDNQLSSGPNDGSTELRLLVHQSQAGCVIGRNGDKIKDLRIVSGGQQQQLLVWSVWRVERHV